MAVQNPISVTSSSYTMNVYEDTKVTIQETQLSYESTNSTYSKYASHSTVYTDDLAYSITANIGAPGKFNIKVAMKASFGYNGSSSSPANSHYRLKVRVRNGGTESIIYDTGDVTGYSAPFSSNMNTAASTSNTTWIDVGTFTSNLSSGEAAVDLLISMYQVNNKHCYTAMNGMRLELSRA